MNPRIISDHIKAFHNLNEFTVFSYSGNSAASTFPPNASYTLPPTKGPIKLPKPKDIMKSAADISESPALFI
jgi:hypothetical protein